MEEAETWNVFYPALAAVALVGFFAPAGPHAMPAADAAAIWGGELYLCSEKGPNTVFEVCTECIPSETYENVWTECDTNGFVETCVGVSQGYYDPTPGCESEYETCPGFVNEYDSCGGNKINFGPPQPCAEEYLTTSDVVVAAATSCGQPPVNP